MIIRKFQIIFVLLFLGVGNIYAVNSINFTLLEEENYIGIDVNTNLAHKRERAAAIREGVPFKIVYDIYLYEKQDNLIRKNILIEKISIIRDVSFDDYNKKYLVKEGESKFHFSYTDNLFKYLLHLRNEELFENLESGKNYLIVLKVRGETITIYFPLSVVFNLFIDLWDFKLGPYTREVIIK